MQSEEGLSVKGQPHPFQPDDPGGGGPCTCCMARSKLGKFEYDQGEGWVTSLASGNKCRNSIFDRHVKCQKKAI